MQSDVRTAARKLVQEASTRQGLPERVTDRATLAQVAELLVVRSEQRRAS